MEAIMPKLTDTQLVILSTAAQRKDHAVLPLPKSLKVKGAAVTKLLEGLRKKGLLEEKPAPHGMETWRKGEDGRRLMLIITEAGLKALDGEPASASKEQPSRGKAPTKNTKADRKRKDSKPKGGGSTPAARQGSKQALLIDLLKRKGGATIDELVTATGWQAHSVRGAISGALKNKLGLAVASAKVDGRGRVYRIAERV
jgi:DNA-binding MarR family transcriptional regulator